MGIAARSCTTPLAETRAFLPGTQNHRQGFASCDVAPFLFSQTGGNSGDPKADAFSPAVARVRCCCGLGCGTSISRSNSSERINRSPELPIPGNSRILIRTSPNRFNLTVSGSLRSGNHQEQKIPRKETCIGNLALSSTWL